MRDISISEMRKLSVEDIKTQMPLRVTSDHIPIAYLVSLEDVVIVSDLHPRVRNTIQMQVRRARGGMPAPEIITKETI